MKKLKKFISNLKIVLKIKSVSIFYWILSIAQLAIIIFIGYFHDRLLEVLTMIPLFFIFRRQYDKQFHASTLWKCSLYSIAIFYFVSLFPLNKSLSLFTSIILMLILTFISYHLRNYLDYLNLKKRKLTNRDRILKVLDNHIDEDYIEEFCTKNGMTYKMSETIYLYLNNTLEETASILEVDMSTISRRIKDFLLRTE